MKVDLFDIDEFVKENNVKEVTNPIFFSPDGTPTDNGLFSYDIFGTTDNERKNIFGYIDLGGHFIHPAVTAIFPRMGSIEKILTGEKYAVVANKKIQVVDETFKDAETGIDFFYNNFEKIDWITTFEEETIDSIDKKTRYKFLKSLKREEFFISKWLVLPPFYRAENSTDRSLGDQINQLYKDLISKTRSIKLGFSFSLFGRETRLKIQNILKQLYLTALSPLSGKHLQSDGSFKGTAKSSLVRKHLLGKTIDFSASNVITAPQVSMAKDYKSVPVPFGYGLFPLPTLLALFQPFFVNYIVGFLEDALSIIANINANEIKKIDISQFNNTEVEKMIKRFIKSEESRFDIIPFEYTDVDGKKAGRALTLLEFNSEADAREKKNIKVRDMTYTDLFYMTAMYILKDKHVYVTRYPIANFQNIYPTRVKVGTTKKTHEKWICYNADFSEVLHYENYPTIPTKKTPANDSRFVDVMIPGNIILKGIQGDYDGDTVYMRGVFSNEANEEAERLIYAKTNLLDASGSPARAIHKLEKEAAIALYELTKDED